MTTVTNSDELTEVLNELNRIHKPSPMDAYLDGGCPSCGDTGIKHGPGANGNWTDEECCCQHAHCDAGCVGCGSCETGDLIGELPDLIAAAVVAERTRIADAIEAEMAECDACPDHHVETFKVCRDIARGDTE